MSYGIQASIKVMDPQQAAQDNARSTIEARVRALYDAWTARDEAKLRTFFIDRPDLKLWGTDAWERIVGKAEADREFASWIATCPPWVSIAETHRAMDVRGGMAWIADDVEGHWVRGAESGSNAFRITTIWHQIGDEWLLVHANFAAA